MTAVPRRAGFPIAGVGFLFMLLAKQWGWDGWWMGLVVFAIGVGTVVQDLFDRRRRKVDEPTTLDIHGRS